MIFVVFCFLGNSSPQSERESQLLFIQFLLESLPAHRYKLIKMLVAYLVRFIEREGVGLKTISFIYGGDSQVMYSIMLAVVEPTIPIYSLYLI